MVLSGRLLATHNIMGLRCVEMWIQWNGRPLGHFVDSATIYKRRRSHNVTGA